MKSFNLTDSGKLISLLSGDLLAVEKQMPVLPFLIAGPILNVAAMLIIYLRFGKWYALVIIPFWVLVYLSQKYISACSFMATAKAMKFND